MRVNVAEAKRDFSEILARVAFGGETVVIMRRGRPMARLVPAAGTGEDEGLAAVKGFLEADDPFFTFVDQAVAGRARRPARLRNDGARKEGAR